MLNQAAFETAFGLRVALNCIDETAVRSIDRKTFEGITTYIREQASKETSFNSFGLNVERDLLRAVVGTPNDTARFGNRLAGMDSLVAAARVDIDSLHLLLKRYLEKYEDEGFKSRFPWVDNITEVRDRAKLDVLNGALITQLRARDMSRKWLAVPDLMEWVDVGGFHYSEHAAGAPLPDIHFDTYFDFIRKPSEISVERLKRNRVFVYSAASEQTVQRWPVYKCIYAEVDMEDGTYLLNAGDWYCVDRDFVSRIDAEIGRIPQTALPLIPYRARENENQYNKRLARRLGSACLMDANNIHFGGGRSALEFCDVYTTGGVMIHVKQNRGSAVLSHLFAQATVSATAFLSDADFRDKLNTKLPRAFRLDNPRSRPESGQYEVALVIADAADGDLRLPFFSRVTLRSAQRHLELMGYRLTMTKAPVEP
ncbi:Hypothetical protein CAP_3749 [Chondromyces apiculatus DSM 436]|uniref:Sporadically distributed protein, TIGR04141 family n=2 Tax=Chondromyces apiculatus TaxID=51 RepID=A0A017T6P9_9BACT|nr:Hypothetical protein CAP_3749 [Chondromyces apiculatus DSM 436]